MTEVASENRDNFRFNYQAGKQALENSQYRLSIQYLEETKKFTASSSRLGGEAQIWLVSAYQAAGMRSEAIALCRELLVHPSLETRKQAKRLLYIIEAPQLKRPKEWLTEIPDLTEISESDIQSKYVSAGSSDRKSKPKNNLNSKEPIDLSQVDTKDNQFLGVALILAILIIAGLFWIG